MPYKLHKSTEFTLNPSKRLIGVEIEIAGMKPESRQPLETTVLKWGGNIGSDPSVSANRLPKGMQFSGAEIRTAPANGDEFIKQMTEIGAIVNKENAYANATCGIHVHVDVSDFKDEDLEKALVLWKRIEDSMFSLVKPARLKNSFCKPLKFKTADQEELLVKYNIGGYRRDRYDGDNCKCSSCKFDKVAEAEAKKKAIKLKLLKSIKDGQAYADRYHALNLNAIREHGTIENRMHHGTINMFDVTNWGIINASFLDYAKNNPIEKLEEFGTKASALLAFSPNETVSKWIKSTHLKQRKASKKPVAKSVRR